MGPSRTVDIDESEWLNILRHLTVPTENAFFFSLSNQESTVKEIYCHL